MPIQFMEDDAPPGTDDDWLTYYSDCRKNEEDNHCKDAGRPSPFYGFYPLVKGFAIDPMHTVYAGAYGRRLIGFRSEVNDGKLSQLLLNQLDNRILFYGQCKPWEFDRKLRSFSSCGKYKHHELRNLLMYYQFPVFFGILPESDLLNIMRLQKGMILLGGSQTIPVPREDTSEAREEFKIYCNELKEKKIPIRYMTHATQHIPDDVDYFKVGVERLAAWVFEIFVFPKIREEWCEARKQGL